MPKRKRTSSKELTFHDSWKRPRYGTASLSASHVSKLVARPRRRFGRAANAGPHYPMSESRDERPKPLGGDGENIINMKANQSPQPLVASPAICSSGNGTVNNARPTIKHAKSSRALSTKKNEKFHAENKDEMGMGCCDSKSYQYSPLADGQIRLLKVLPGTDEDAMRIELETIDDMATASYTALSYTWGDQIDLDPIFITNHDHHKTRKRASGHYYSKDSCLELGNTKGSSFSVGKNLSKFLRRYRRLHETHYLWVDALCINQADHLEKVAQVKMMADIYRSADRVLIWLGDGDDDSLKSQIAMETIPDIVDTKRHAAMLADDDQIWKWASVLELMNNDWYGCTVSTRVYSSC
jgi:hypothetical protein